MTQTTTFPLRTAVAETSTAAKQESAPLSDEALLLRYRDTGDDRAFAELVRRYEKDLYRFLRMMLGNGALAEDVFQATFLKLHLNCDRFRSNLKLRPWLFRIARNQAIDAVRRGRRHRMTSLEEAGGSPSEGGSWRDALPDGGPLPEERLETEETRAWMRRAVQRLPEPMRQVVTLIHLEGLRYQEAADRLAIPIGTLKSRAHAALKLLRERCPAQFAPVNQTGPTR